MIRINLLPVERKVEIPRAFKHILLAGLLFFTAIAGVGLYWHEMNLHLDTVKQEARKKENIRKKLDKVIEEVKRFKKTKVDLEEKLETIERLKENQQGPLRLLSELRDRFPRPVWVSSIQLRKGRVSLRGYALTLSSVGDLVENLKGSEYFDKVDYKRSKRMSQQGREIYNFQVTFKFTPDPEKEAERLAKKLAEKKKKKD